MRTDGGGEARPRRSKREVSTPIGYHRVLVLAGSVDPGGLSAGCISEVRFDFSAASPFSRHEARD